MFAEQLARGDELGAGFAVYRRGECVVDLWGGVADARTGAPWRRDSRVVVFSVTKGLAAMAFALLADRGKLDWDAPVAAYWPEFAAGGKEGVTARMLLSHRAGLVLLDEALTLEECVDPGQRGRIAAAAARQRPMWRPGERQGYHAVTFGIYASELFERIAGERLGVFLGRELFDPLGADVSLGTPPEVDARMARLVAPGAPERFLRILATIPRGDSPELRVLRQTFSPNPLLRRAFLNPRVGPEGPLAYDAPEVRRAELAWASATASAHGLARAYLPFASGGRHGDRVFFRPETLRPMRERQSWSERDLVVQKAMGWSCGFLKEETTMFSPNPESFGHAGMGGALGWCDPVEGLTIGYAMNRLDWRVRSPRALALCRALYACEPLRASLLRQLRRG